MGQVIRANGEVEANAPDGLVLEELPATALDPPPGTQTPSMASEGDSSGDGASLSKVLLALVAGTLVGGGLAVTTLMDWTGLANWAFVVVLTLAHVCAGVLVGFVINGIRRRRTRRAWTTIRWLVTVLVVGGLLWYLDSFVIGLSHQPGLRAGLLTLSLLAVAGGLTWEVVAERDSKPGDPSMPTRLLVIGVAAVPIGALLPVALVDNKSDQRQGAFDTDLTFELPPVSLPPGTDTYVALGDSYSAGEGVRPFLSSSEPHCHRSAFAYPRLLTFAPVEDESPVAVEFRACSGAVTADVDLGAAGGFGPQLDLVDRDDVGLVTFTVGGNDVIFSTVVRQCIMYEDCVDEPFDPPAESPQRPTVQYPPRAETFRAWAEVATGDEYLAGNLRRVYRAVEAAYPNARILVVGYPYLFPERPATSWLDFDDCASVLRRVDQDERKDLRTLMDDLNALLAREAYAANIEFVSTEHAWAGHEPCGAQDQWTNAVRLDLSNVGDLAILNGASFHPNRRGQLELARLLACYLSGYADELDAAPPAGVPGTARNPLVSGDACVGPS